MKLVGSHALLKFGTLDDLADEGVRIEQDIIIEKHVVNPDDAFFAEVDVVEKRRACVQVHAEAEVEVVVEICAGGDDPVDESCLEEWNDGRSAEARRCESAGEGHADGPVCCDHFFGEQTAGFGEATSVVCLECAVDEVGCGDAFADGFWEKPRETLVQ